MQRKLSYFRFLKIFLIFSIPLILLSATLYIISYTNMIIEIYSYVNLTSTSSTTQRINYLMSSEKTEKNFYDLENLLNETYKASDDILNVSLVNSNDEIIKSVGSVEVTIPEGISSNKYLTNNSGVFCCEDIDDEYKIVLLLSNDYVNEVHSKHIKAITFVSLIILISIILISFIIYIILSKRNNGNGPPLKSFKNLFITSIVISQVALGGYVLSNYTNEYQASLDKMALIISNVIDADLEYMVNQGVPLEKLTSMDDHLKDIYKDIKEIVSISISKSKPENTATKNNFISNKIQILDQDYYINIEYKIDEEFVNKTILHLLIEALILVVVTILIAIEVSLFISNSRNETRKKKEINPSVLRIFYFVLFLALGLDASFISIISYQLFSELDAASNLLISLPTAICAVATIIGFLICLFSFNKIGIQNLIIMGSILVAIGSVLSGFCDDLYKFSFARGIVGLGMAALLASTKLCAVFGKSSHSRISLLATIAAGKMSGYCCGIVIGGLISARSSYSFVFILEAIIVLLTTFFIRIINLKRNNSENNIFSFSSMVGMFKSFNVVIYMTLIIIPIYMASIFISYCIPLYGHEIKLSQSFIASLMMLNFILSAYTSNTGSTLAMKWMGPQKSTLLYVVSIIFSLSLFSLTNNLVSMIITVVLLGIADGFGLNVIFEEIYIINPDIDKVGATFMFLLASEIGEAIAPVLVSFNISNGIANASTILVYVITAAAILYLIFSLFTRKKVKTV